MDYTKYNLSIIQEPASEILNLPKRKLAKEVIRYLLDHELESNITINEQRFNNKQIVASSEEYEEYTPDKKKRFFKTELTNGVVYISNQWGKPSIERLIDFVENNHSDHLEITEIVSESEFEEEERDLYIQNIPLNQIFYGPPGTGKTYNISSEAERIINNVVSNEALTFEEKFDRVVRNIRSEFDAPIYNKLNGNNIYRNFSKSMVVWGLFLDPRYDANNTIIHEDLKDVEGFKRSGWSQRVRYLTEFGYIDGDWVADLSGQLGFDMTLSETGEELKEQLRDYLAEEGINEADLLHWDRNQGIPDVVRDSYLNVIRNVSPIQSNMTAFKKTIFSALNMCVQGNLFKQNQESRDSTEEEIELVETYFDVNGQENSDYKWVGWVAENLVDLQLVEKIDEERNLRYYYRLTEMGRLLVESVVNRWEHEYPHLFGRYLTYDIAFHLGQVEFITFHQSYSYEEFIEGIRPNMNGDEELTYVLEKGVFRRISDRAKHDLSNNYVIIIDEINRGNISKIFGELITLIEPTKRLFTDPVEHPQKVTLPYSKRTFGVPKNLYILGTMNTADKSIALLDSALRRRFIFKEMLPNPALVESEIEIEGVDIKTLFTLLNERIEFLIDKDHTIGHSYFLKIKDDQTIFSLAKVFSNEIIPLLLEYFYGDYEKIRLVLGDNKEWNKDKELNFIIKKTNKQNLLFGTEIEGFEDKESYEINPILYSNDSEQLEKLFQSIYDKNVRLRIQEEHVE